LTPQTMRKFAPERARKPLEFILFQKR